MDRDLWPADGDAAPAEERLAALEAVRAVTDVAYRYARFVDDQDGLGVASLFLDDGLLFPQPGVEPLAGRALIGKLYGKLLPQMTSSTHVVSNPQVTLLSADHAVLECVLWAWEGFSDKPSMPPADRYTFGRYRMEMRRSAQGGWLIGRMDIIFAGQADSGRFAEHLSGRS
ncbi:nuclear transport factor 2 family protein [Adlercreutzia aquisgranensis]|uniref:Nuclear transport factor 2 family protein n=1 Tax=Muribaculaceae bacterium Z82 TaxID=2304548 RepID=A0A7C9JMV5_9BACT|nr:nuclear transport factor 2 family protein [Adlercreutzia aquisgranensis]